MFKAIQICKSSVSTEQFGGGVQVAIDRRADAPGHIKDVVDGLNAQAKVFLRKHMISACATGEPIKDPNAKVKMDTDVVDGENKAISFAK